MNAEEIREVIAKKNHYVELSDYNQSDKLRNKEIEILSRDINDTIKFLREEATYDDFYWITEVVDQVAAKVQSMDFLNCLYEVNDKFIKQGYEDNWGDIKYADFETLRPYEKYCIEHDICQELEPGESEYLGKKEDFIKFFKKRDELERRFQEELAKNPDPDKLIIL